MQESVKTVDSLLSALDRSPLRPFHRRLLILCGFGWLFDAMDILLVGSIVAAIGATWKLSSTQVGDVISANLLGLFFGALVAGPLADRFGRRTIFGVTLLLFSVFSGLSAFAWDHPSLLIVRFLAGLGMGGELPVAVTLLSEFAPARSRGRLLVLLESFWGYGAVIAALVSYLVIPRYGWQIAFLIGALPALYVLVLRRSLPESPRYLAVNGQTAQAITVVNQVLGESIPPDTPLAQSNVEIRSRRAKLADLFSSAYRSRTIMLWLLWFAMVFSYYGIFTWLPSLLRGRGFSLEEAFLLNLLISLAQIPGYFTAAYLVERWGRKPTLLVFLAACAITALLFGLTGLSGTGKPSVESILLWGALTAFFNLGAWGIVYTYTPEQYPTRIRATGSGLATAFGRLGGVIAPLLMGRLLDLSGQNTVTVFVIFTVLLLVGATSVLLLGQETKGRTLEEIEAAPAGSR